MTAATAGQAPAPEISPPDPSFTEDLVRGALGAFAPPAPPLDPLLELLAEACARPVPEELAAWLPVIAGGRGFPLFGTGRTAETYPALLFNGARLDAAARRGDWAPLLAGLAILGDGDLAPLAGAMNAARYVAGRLTAAEPGGAARASLGTIAAATSAALCTGADHGRLTLVLDTAASLMIFSDASAGAPDSALRSGHDAAAGWLAARLPEAPVTPMAGSVVHTMSAAAGRGVGGDAGSVRFRTAAELLGALG